MDPENLLEFRNDAGEVAPVVSLRDWRARRAGILAALETVIGPLPEPSRRVPLDIAVEEEVDGGTFVRRLITYRSEPESRVPAYLLIPKAALDGSGAQRPGVLCLMPTVPAGHKAVVGLDVPGRPTYPNYAYGRELAERGYVIIAPAYPLLANYHPDLRKLGYRSGIMKGIWDSIRALDVLASLPFVRQGGFGSIGHSLGGHNAIFVALYDQRIRVIVSSAGFDSFVDYEGAPWTQGRGWAMERYMPGILDYPRTQIPFDFHELIGALAPRPIFASAPVKDKVFKWQSASRVISAASQIYRLYEMPAAVRLVHPDTGHDFPPDVREMAYAWIDRFLL